MKAAFVRSAPLGVVYSHYMFHVWSPFLRTSYAWRKPYLRREWPETEAAPTKGV